MKIEFTNQTSGQTVVLDPTQEIITLRFTGLDDLRTHLQNLHMMEATECLNYTMGPEPDLPDAEEVATYIETRAANLYVRNGAEAKRLQAMATLVRRMAERTSPHPAQALLDSELPDSQASGSASGGGTAGVTGATGPCPQCGGTDIEIRDVEEPAGTSTILSIGVCRSCGYGHVRATSMGDIRRGGAPFIRCDTCIRWMRCETAPDYRCPRWVGKAKMPTPSPYAVHLGDGWHVVTKGGPAQESETHCGRPFFWHVPDTKIALLHPSLWPDAEPEGRHCGCYWYFRDAQPTGPTGASDGYDGTGPVGPDFAYAPWTDKQVESLNNFQQYSGVHPFTCTECWTVLVAKKEGWECPACGQHRQTWAHKFMTIGTEHWRLRDWSRFVVTDPPATPGLMPPPPTTVLAGHTIECKACGKKVPHGGGIAFFKRIELCKECRDEFWALKPPGPNVGDILKCTDCGHEQPYIGMTCTECGHPVWPERPAGEEPESGV